jgi:lipopolysaccharide export system protein LptA
MKIRSCNAVGHMFAVFLVVAAGLCWEAIRVAPVSADEPEQQPLPNPIEITSDMMVTNSQTHAAVFSGNVTATQGDSRLTTDQLTIFYK